MRRHCVAILVPKYREKLGIYCQRNANDNRAMTTRRLKITAREYIDPNRPNLKFMVAYREAGKRKRAFFEKQKEAESFADFKNAQRQSQGTEHAEFPMALRIMAQECTARLNDYKRADADCPPTIKDATDFFIAHLKASANSCSAEELVKELVAKKEGAGLSARHVDDLRSRLNIFAKKFDGLPVATITSTAIEDWLDSLAVSAVTRNHYRRLIILAFNYAIKRGYAAKNPATETEKAKEAGDNIGILTVTQAAQLLENATPNVLPYFAIGLFAGLRRAELERLDWKEIDFDSGLIEVTAKNAKTARRRHVTIQPNLRAWLMPLRQIRGSVTPQNTSEFWQAFNQTRAAAGIDPWPSNALRHSFASYHLAHFKNAKALALEMGHVNENMIFTNYRQLVKPKEAARYWTIRPSSLATKKVVAFKA
jgi:integrase